MFADLDPSASRGEGGVYVAFPPQRARVTWLEVPEADTGNLVTVQLTLFTNGRVLVVFGDQTDVDDGIFGVAPFGGSELGSMPARRLEEALNPSHTRLDLL